MISARTAVRDWWKPGPQARLLISLLLLLLASPTVLANPRVGVTADLAPLSAAERTAVVERLRLAGATAVRLPLDWNRVEPQPGKFDWEADDAAVDVARAGGLEVVLTLGPAAVWAVDAALGIPTDQVRFSLPKSPEPWERYVQRSAKHFQRRVKYWQVREQPNTRNFRGSISEYLNLLQMASRTLREIDPEATIILPESVPFDPAGLEQRLRPPWGDDWQIWGAYLPAQEDLTRSLLALSVLAAEAMPQRPRRPIWVVGAESTLPADLWVQYYLLASACGAAQFFAPEEVIHRDWVPELSRLQYLGFLRLGPEIWALVFEDQEGPVVATWSTVASQPPASALAPVADTALVRQTARLGGAPGSAVTGDRDDPILLLGPRPVLVRGLEVRARLRPGPPTRDDVLAARPGPSPRARPEVSVDYDRAEPEQGLYNRALRALPGGAIREEPHPVRIALGTNMRPLPSQAELDNPWIHFDVDDRWLYFARGRTPVAITVEYEASRRGEKWIGFNLYYDSVTGYRSAPWHWVESGEGWRTHRFLLEDASFTNRNGYDFRINAKGSKQDLWVASVRLEKLPAD